MAETNLALAILFALLFTITLNLSKGIQKYGIAGLSLEVIKQWRERPELKRNFIIWALGSAGTAVASLFQISAQPYSPSASFVPAFSGIGLMSLVIFSYLVLHEPIGWVEIIGTVLIIVFTLLFGLTADATPTLTIEYRHLAILFIIPIVILLGFAKLSHDHDHKGHAFIWGLIAGFCSGFSIALSHTAALEGDRTFIGMIFTWNIILSLAAAQGAFWFTQVGFRHGQASIVVSFYMIFSLIVPIVIDLFVLDYRLETQQLALLVCIGVGILMLTAFRKEKQVEKVENGD